MKHEQHIERRSFQKWAMPGQRIEPFTPNDVHHRTKSKQPHAQMVGRPPAFVSMIKSHDGFFPRDVGRSNGGARVPSKGKAIPAHRYAAYLESAYLRG